MGTIGTHAVIVGGSIGGLTAAQVASERFDRVTVLERDALPEGDQERRGVPQAGHAHTLLLRGRQELERLFPGITEELLKGGAVPLDPGQDVLFYQAGEPRVRFDSGQQMVTMSRVLLEGTLRRRVRSLPNVELRDRAAASGLTGSPGRVTGVEIDDGEPLRADLVIDATGRSATRTDRWLTALGCPTPEVTSVRIDVGYTTRLYHRATPMLPGRALAYASTGIPPEDKRAVAVAPIESDRWIVTLGGWHHGQAPAEPEGFEQFAAGLPSEHIAELLASTDPLDEADARRYTSPTARRRHYERISRPAAGLVALGDAVCSFNPLYGQGMTIAILEATALGRCLDRQRSTSSRMTRAFFREVNRIVDGPWKMSIANDFLFPETTGRRPRGLALQSWFFQKAVLASHVSESVHRAILDVTNLLRPPSVMLRPDVLARTFWAARSSPARPTARRRR